ncbi:MAG: hypothetical protein AVDCRST_MAG93-9704 [uncultured Chloroflexia bacterium]|uniref:Uncharacterized protein n=1 Tax=uncultured Chloroflexia bacterium TaxID=1672391 RepID=A0A6J4NKR9_9CHLR|nr:MAG: hypothetical protein AVDCRST_MAG93-9704 [uncultured Chloroflexia bacterium]
MHGCQEQCVTKACEALPHRRAQAHQQRIDEQGAVTQHGSRGSHGHRQRLCADRCRILPAIVWRGGNARQTVARIEPERGPFLGLTQDAVRIGLATRDEMRKIRTAGRLSHWVIAQVEAPADMIAAVFERCVLCAAMHEQHVTRLHRERNYAIGVER